MKNYTKIGISIILAVLTILAWIYALFTWKITFKEFSDVSIEQAEIIDNNLEEYYSWNTN